MYNSYFANLYISIRVVYLILIRAHSRVTQQRLFIITNNMSQLTHTGQHSVHGLQSETVKLGNYQLPHMTELF